MVIVCDAMPSARCAGPRTGCRTTSARRVAFACSVSATLRPSPPGGCRVSRHATILSTVLRSIDSSSQVWDARFYAAAHALAQVPQQARTRQSRLRQPTGHLCEFPRASLSFLIGCCGCQVTHSMGGLLTKHMLMDAQASSHNQRSGCCRGAQRSWLIAVMCVGTSPCLRTRWASCSTGRRTLESSGISTCCGLSIRPPKTSRISW